LKRVSITRGFLAIIVICSILLGALFSFVLINPNILGLVSSGNQITVSSEDYNRLINRYEKYEKVEKVWQRILATFYDDVDEKSLEDGMIKGLVEGLGDVYSSYYDAEDYESIEASLVGEYSGVGITMVQEESHIRVLKVNKNSPAAEGGVTLGEYIVAVDGVVYAPEEMDQCAAAIRGEKGTSVTVKFLKGSEYIERTFVRDTILTETVDHEILDNNIGYIDLYGFEKGTYDDFVLAMEDLKDTDGIVLDMRSNPGGMVDTALNIADLFLDKATLIYTEDHDGTREYLNTKNGTLWDKPLVIIVDENSASAAEILAGGLQDNGRAKVVGTVSFGKGVIQELIKYEDGSALKLTEWQYFTPSGKAINKVGIQPDYLVELDDECYDEQGYLIEDKQLNKAIEVLSGEIQ